MKLIVAALLGVVAVAGCAKAPPPFDPREPTPAFKVESGHLQDFADYRSICVRAIDQEGRRNLTAVAVSVLVRELPGFSNSCETTAFLEVSFQTGHGAYTHSPATPPRFGFGHVGRRGSRNGAFVAEAAVFDHTTGEDREEAIRKVATLLANFLRAAQATTQPLVASPSSIAVTEDVSLEPYEYERESKRIRAILQFFNDETKVVIPRGQRFQMISSVGQMEGGCRIRFESKNYEVASCFWLEGFADHRSDIFVVIKN